MVIPDSNSLSKLQVGVNGNFGPYWILKVAPDFSWAIVSGGPPTAPSGAACAPDGVTHGLWLYSRASSDPSATQVMRQELEGLGINPGVLVPVAQAGCTYE